MPDCVCRTVEREEAARRWDALLYAMSGHIRVTESIPRTKEVEDLYKFVPQAITHVRHTQLMRSLFETLLPLYRRGILSEPAVKAWVETAAMTLDRKLASSSSDVRTSALRVVAQPEIKNFRYDRRYWQIVFSGSLNDPIFDKEASALACIEGYGLELHRGRLRGDWTKRAYSHQVAYDAKNVATSRALAQKTTRVRRPRATSDDEEYGDDADSSFSSDEEDNEDSGRVSLSEHDSDAEPGTSKTREEEAVASLTRTRTRELKRPRWLDD